MPRYKRRIRIEGRPEDTAGYMLTVKDAGTGEDIHDIVSVVLTLKPSQISTAAITYVTLDPVKKHFVRDVVLSDNPEVSLTAYETFTDAQKFASKILDMLAEQEPHGTTLERIEILCKELLEKDAQS